MTASAETIERLEQEEVRAFLAADVDRLRALWSPDFLVNAPHHRLMAEREATLAAIASGALRHVRLERSVEIVRFTDGLAVSMGGELVEDDRGPLAGAPYRRRFTHVWRLDGADWRLLARHAHVIG